MTTQPPARWTFPDLAHADALLDQHRADAPVLLSPEWLATFAQLAARRDAEVSAVRGLLCGKCEGTGRTRWRHRLHGVCFTCKGDGWSARGRRQAANATRAGR